MFFSSSNSRKHGLDVASQYEVMQRCRRISSVDKAYVREHHTQTWPYWWYGGSVGDWNGWHMGTLGSRSKNLGFYHRETKVQKQVETALKRALSLDGFLHRTRQKYPKKMPKMMPRRLPQTYWSEALPSIHSADPFDASACWAVSHEAPTKQLLKLLNRT